jgi:hypothetical protein
MQPPVASGSEPVLIQPNTALKGETLSTTTGQALKCYDDNGEDMIKFRASGQAAGPYSGTFTASVAWEWRNGGPSDFSETSYIKTPSPNSRTITVVASVSAKNAKGFNCKVFNHAEPYTVSDHSRKRRGVVSIDITAKPFSFRNYFKS